ncbi:MAG: 23S rRNA (adenine(2030)-N(6))-methyltransferase RlmJ [Pseudooceanicola sp.]|nr:23S rRNA (adenine(2030)-N(6))-methyltransferase RlmJ [Pseudooceanicola sp.]
MLSYQHAYHAGNMADVHKHALLAWVLDYLAQKPKPFVYIETHAGRGLYDLASPEALKTGEAAAGIGRVEAHFTAGHPYLKALKAARLKGGPNAYPGSPFIAQALLRPSDRITLAERHPAEARALRAAFPGVDVRETDGVEMALAVCPPTPRRGALLIDPSYEIKDDFAAMPKLLAQLHRKWPVGVLMLWYPILASGAEKALVRAIGGMEAMHHRLTFPPAREGHGMIGSGMVVVNPPWGLEQAAADLDRLPR